MATRALVMAGGQGSRMAKDGIVVPKPLVPVLGVPLLQRNLVALLKSGFKDLAVAVQHGSAAARWSQTEAVALAAAWGARLELVEEQQRLGTFGAVASVPGDTLVVVYADNLTDLDLGHVLREHLTYRPAMTVCTHLEPVSVPYGVARVEAQELVEYREKPQQLLRIVSGIYVLGREARAVLTPGCPASAPEVVSALLARGARVRAFSHAARWIDVNDAAAIHRAEALILRHPEFDRCTRWPEVEVVGVVLFRPSQVLLEWRPPSRSCYAGMWDTPGGKIHANEAPAAAAIRELEEELGLEYVEPRELCCFDDRDLSSRRTFRHHVFEVALDSTPEPREGQRLRWFDREAVAALDAVSPIALRSLAAQVALRRIEQEVN